MLRLEIRLLIANGAYAFALAVKGVWIIKLLPPIVLALITNQCRPTQALVIWDVHGNWVSLGNDEHVVFLLLLRAGVDGSVDTPIILFKGLSCGERLRPATSIFYCDRAVCDDSGDKPGMVVPDTHLARRNRKPSRRHRGRTINDLRMKVGANAKYCRSRRIGDSTDKNYDAEADYQDQPVSESVHRHLDLLFTSRQTWSREVGCHLDLLYWMLGDSHRSFHIP